MREVRIRNLGNATSAGIRVTIKGREMVTRVTYIADETSLPAVMFCTDVDELTVRVE